jgi:hypothetical protein
MRYLSSYSPILNCPYFGRKENKKCKERSNAEDEVGIKEEQVMLPVAVTYTRDSVNR